MRTISSWCAGLVFIVVLWIIWAKWKAERFFQKIKKVKKKTMSNYKFSWEQLEAIVDRMEEYERNDFEPFESYSACPFCSLWTVDDKLECENMKATAPCGCFLEPTTSGVPFVDQNCGSGTRSQRYERIIDCIHGIGWDPSNIRGWVKEYRKQRMEK